MTTKYRHLTHYDRHILGKLKKSGHGIRETARIMGFAPSTISRELRRNRFQLNNYSCHHAQTNTNARRCKANQSRAKLQPKHREFIHQKLTETLSPEQIASLFPASFKFSISTKAIYRFIHSFSRHWLDLKSHLRKKSKLHRSNWRITRNAEPFKPPRISLRSKQIDNRRTYGHWEMDIMEGPKPSAQSVLVLVERKSRYSIATLVPDLKAATIREKAAAALERFKVISITTDNGKEFQQYEALTQALGAKIYYCHPYRSWEKGSVENTIGLFREFFPKKKIIPHDPTEIERVQQLINNRPRKVCNFKTPISLLPKILA